MATAPTISPLPADGPAIHDYHRLRREGLGLIQRHAGAVWTDYNEHDPGVTTLEQLCYALTELGYRADLPFADLWADATGRIDAQRQALHGPYRILPGAPLTVNDYRRLLLDRLPELGNAWFTPLGPGDGAEAGGLYAVTLYLPRLTPALRANADDYDARRAIARRRAHRVYARYRNLGEDVAGITVLEPVAAELRAGVRIDASAAPHRVLAELLYRAALFFAPEPRRRPLEALTDAGISPSAIFAGPLPRRGFIADAELTARPSQVMWSQLLRALTATPGVLSVNDLGVSAEAHEAEAAGSDGFEIAADTVLRLTSGLDRDAPPIRLMRGGAECRADPAQVRRELDRLWRSHHRAHVLSRDCAERFPMPRGTARDLARYQSIQLQYPAAYGIGPRGLPADAPPLRRAQARQLKGYLLTFEQLMADFLARLAQARDQFSTQPEIEPANGDRWLRDAGPGIAELLRGDTPPDDRGTPPRDRFLDLLLALYAEDPPAATADKLALLRRIVPLGLRRALGFDYLAPALPHTAAGLEIRLGAGVHLVEHVLLRHGGGQDRDFTVSAVIAGDRRHEIAATLRAGVPAHLDLLIHDLPAEAMAHFARHHAAWRHALRHGHRHAIADAAGALRRFLNHHPGIATP